MMKCLILCLMIVSVVAIDAYYSHGEETQEYQCEYLYSSYYVYMCDSVRILELEYVLVMSVVCLLHVVWFGETLVFTTHFISGPGYHDYLCLDPFSLLMLALDFGETW